MSLPPEMLAEILSHLSPEDMTAMISRYPQILSSDVKRVFVSLKRQRLVDYPDLQPSDDDLLKIAFGETYIQVNLTNGIVYRLTSLDPDFITGFTHGFLYLYKNVRLPYTAQAYLLNHKDVELLVPDFNPKSKLVDIIKLGLHRRGTVIVLLYHNNRVVDRIDFIAGEYKSVVVIPYMDGIYAGLNCQDQIPVEMTDVSDFL